LDLLAVVIDSSLVSDGRLAVHFAFPFGSGEMQAAIGNNLIGTKQN